MTREQLKDKLANLEQRLNQQQPQRLHETIRQRDAARLFDQLKTIFDHTPIQLVFCKKLTDLLRYRWHAVKGTYLCYTATPQSEATDICCDIADYLAKQYNSSALQYLMPTVQITQHPTTFESLGDNDIRQVIKQHILSDNYQYLIPADLLASLAIDAELGFFLGNTLFYYDASGNPVQLTDDEQKRLIGHSDLSQHLINAKRAFDNAQGADNSLYTAIYYLERAFRKAGKSGIERATEYEAGYGATSGLMTFRRYCNELANI